jgi:hypothetical protein
VTVFGQLISGSSVLDAIASVQVAAGNRTDDETGLPSKPVEEIIIEYIRIERIPLLEEEPEVTTQTRRQSENRTPDVGMDINLNDPEEIETEDETETETDGE